MSDLLKNFAGTLFILHANVTPLLKYKQKRKIHSMNNTVSSVLLTHSCNLYPKSIQNRPFRVNWIPALDGLSETSINLYLYIWITKFQVYMYSCLTIRIQYLLWTALINNVIRTSVLSILYVNINSQRNKITKY